MKIVEKMFDGPVDVVGDVHGHHEALQALLEAMGYAPDGSHPDGRRMVFVGDLIDRGPDSVAVVRQVMGMVMAGKAQCVLGNHEVNLLRDAPKVDNRWFFSGADRSAGGQRHATEEDRETISKFLNGLPLALERDDLRVVHACWHAESIERLQAETDADSDIAGMYQRFLDRTDAKLESDGLLDHYRKEKTEYDALVRYGTNDPHEHWPDARLLPGYAAVNEAHQMGNPISILTSGEERAAQNTYPAGGKFRFVNRVAWWDDYRDRQAVIIGHYWRLCDFGIPDRPRTAAVDVLDGAGPGDWFGVENNVYCVDFSVGGRGSWYPADVCRLGAISWPEATLTFDDGERLATGFGRRAS